MLDSNLPIEAMNPFEARIHLEQEIEELDTLKAAALKTVACHPRGRSRELMKLIVALIKAKRHLQSKAVQLRQFTEY